MITELKRCQNENTALESEIRLLNTDGESVWTHLRAVPMPERNLIFVSVYNITPLKDKIGQLDNFFTLSPDLFSVIDFKGHFIRVNPAWQRLLGWTSEQLMSEEFLSFVHVEDRERTAIQYANNMEGADTVLFENRLRSVNGTPRWVEWKSVTLLEEQIIFAIARDITSRKLYQSKQKEVEVEKATNQAKSVFLAAMSHELKTPLNGVVGLANLAYSEANTNSLKELLGSLKESADSLIKIVDDIFDYSAIDSGEIEFDPQPFSLRSIITDIEQSYTPVAKKKSLQLNSEFDLSLPDIVVSDANRISQVLRNLVDNAIRFTEEGSVTIKVQSCLPLISHHSNFESQKNQMKTGSG